MVVFQPLSTHPPPLPNPPPPSQVSPGPSLWLERLKYFYGNGICLGIHFWTAGNCGIHFQTSGNWYTLLGSRKLLYTFKTAENCYTPLDSRKLLHTFKTAENCYTLSRQQKTDTGYRYDIDFVWALGLMPSGTLSDTLAQSEGQNNPFAAMLCDTGGSRVIVCCEVCWR